MEKTHCIICQSSKGEFYKNIKNRIDIKESYSLVKCLCGLVYLNPRLPENEIKKYYNTPNYLPHSYNNTIINLLYNNFQKITFIWKYKLLKKYNKSCNNLLDIGGGKGEFVSYLNKKNIKSYNYEPYLETKKKYSKRTLANNNEFDVITLWHSLEHIYNIDELFDSLNKNLKIGGYVFIAIPNHDAYERKKFFKDNWVAYDLPRHLYHFNYFTFEKLVNKYKYKIIGSHRMIQDTLFNTIFSLNNNNIIKLIYINILTLIATIFNKKSSSSLLFICEKQY